MQRPLKVGETKGGVLHKCGRSIKQRKLFSALSTHVQLLFSQQYSKCVPQEEQEVFQRS